MFESERATREEEEEDGEEEVEEEEEEEEEEEDLVQLPIHPHPMAPRNMSGFTCHMCDSKQRSPMVEGYWCNTCVSCHFHKECAESPVELNHPYHPLHSLSFRPIDLDIDDYSELCSYCGKELGMRWVYSCLICDKNFMHLLCAKKPPVLEVDQPKSHDHKLFLLPKLRLFTCDACGLILDSPSLPWACLLCGVLLHRDCIDLPRVIRISRHHHRLSYSSSSPAPSHEASSWSCGVCRKAVDNHYGTYSCIKGCHDCVFHPKCATRGDVWDGKDLYGEPEESEDVEEPFEVIDDKTIRHFSHEHNLKLDEDDYDGSEHCQACALPIRIKVGNIYSCMQRGCDFILHEACANLPRKLWYMIHPHNLKLEVCRTNRTICIVCARECCGFIYRCWEKGCYFEADANCSSVSEPFIHASHPHPLFSTSVRMRGHSCSGCKECKLDYMMECMECDFKLCLRCITLPPKIRYRQDRHPLVLGVGEDINGENWWCEICEERMDSDVLYYTCDSCCATVHVGCVLGADPLMKPGSHFDEFGQKLEVVANSSCCRPLCHGCQDRSPFPVVFVKDDHHFCSRYCLKTYLGEMIFS